MTPGLESLGLHAGDRVRFRKVAGGRWQEAVVAGREKDGSVTLHDAKGATRSIIPERLEVRSSGARGAVTWTPLPEWAARAEQLTIL
jgi:hypothetical protein